MIVIKLTREILHYLARPIFKTNVTDRKDLYHNCSAKNYMHMFWRKSIHLLRFEKIQSTRTKIVASGTADIKIRFPLHLHENEEEK